MAEYKSNLIQDKCWGHIDIILGEYLKANKINKYKLAKEANIQPTQILKYCRNEKQRPDLGVLNRICYVLKCEISDILRYVPPDERKSL